MICLIFPSAYQLARAWKVAFEYEKKQSRQSNNRTKKIELVNL